MRKFIFDLILDQENICNLKKDQQYLLEKVNQGKHVVFSGRRNMGKTSLVKSILIPEFRKTRKNSLVVFIDFMGIKSMHQLNQRVRIAFEKGLAGADSTRNYLKKFGEIIKGIRPSISVDAFTGAYSVSLGIDKDIQEIEFEPLFEEMGRYHEQNESLLIIDEFQDISFVGEAEARIRNSLQNLPADLPIVILGSKKHLLSKIFGDHSSPLANWGVHYEISTISAEEYQLYINERFSLLALDISLENTKFVQNLVQGIPECVNIICDKIMRQKNSSKRIAKEDIVMAFKNVVEERRSMFEERIIRFTEKEQKFLATLAKMEPVNQPNGKVFLQKVGLSPGGNRPILNRLEDEAIIYKQPEGYVINDPIFAEYLRLFR